MQVTWLIHMCAMTQSCVQHDSFIFVTWLIHICDMTHSYMWHDSSIHVTPLIPKFGLPFPKEWHDPFVCVAKSMHLCEIPHFYAFVWNTLFLCICVKCLILTRLMTYREVIYTSAREKNSCDVATIWTSSICAKYLIDVCDSLSHAHIRRASFLRDIWYRDYGLRYRYYGYTP